MYCAIEGYYDELAETESWHRNIYSLLFSVHAKQGSTMRWKIPRIDDKAKDKPEKIVMDAETLASILKNNHKPKK